MQLAALKTGAAAGWAAVRLVLDIVVIGPVFIFSFIFVLSAWPSPGTFILTQAEGLVRGAEAGKVWGCASLSDAVSLNQGASPLLLRGVPEPVLCLPTQVSRDAYAVGFDHSVYQLYGLVATLYAVFYLAVRFALNHFARNTTVAVGRQATSGIENLQEKQHGKR
ncbi:hypothetical protein FS594_28935 (plasmid) [Rahnella aquatilis]|nr:hypothetical protein FS594_28935 [Rahnella aquatilis]